MSQFIFQQISWNRIAFAKLTLAFIAALIPAFASAGEAKPVTAGNFGLPGIIDLPTARRFPDGELIVTQQLHKSLARSGISFQALPSVGLSFPTQAMALMVDMPTIALTMTGVLTPKYPFWLRENISQLSPLDSEILSARGGTLLNILWARNHLETLN